MGSHNSQTRFSVFPSHTGQGLVPDFSTQHYLPLLQSSVGFQWVCGGFLPFSVDSWGPVFIISGSVFCLHVCSCTTCTIGDRGHQKSASGPLELELQTVVNCPVGAGNRTGSSGRSSRALNLQAVTSPSTSILYLGWSPREVLETIDHLAEVFSRTHQPAPPFFGYVTRRTGQLSMASP